MKKFFLLLALLFGAPAFAADCAATNTTGGDTRVFQPCTKNDVPTISGTENQTAVDVWGPYHIACGSGGASPSWSGTLPTGLSISSSTGRITGTPTADGSVASSLTCTNSVGSETINFTWNIAVVSSGGAPYDLTAGGTRTVPFAYEWPTEPVTTRNVSVGSASAFNTQAAIDGTQITITNSFTGNILITGDDIDVVMDNAHTISGTLILGNYSSSSRQQRFRWTGGNFVNSGIRIFAATDVMFDDVFFNTDANIALERTNDFRGLNSNSAIQGILRTAIINSSIYHINGNSSGDYALYSPNSASLDFILANVKLRNAGGQTHRAISLHNFIVVDSAINDNGAASSGFRIHGNGTIGSNPVYMADTMIRGTFKVDGTASVQGPQVNNGTFERVTRYANDGLFWYSENLASGNSGTVNDSPHFSTGGGVGGEVGLGSGFSGSNNIRQAWNGSTVPDYSGVGAVR